MGTPITNHLEYTSVQLKGIYKKFKKIVFEFHLISPAIMFSLTHEMRLFEFQKK